MDEIKNDNSREQWMGEVRIPKKLLHTEMEGEWRGRPLTRWIDLIRKDVEMRGKLGRNTRKQEVGE